MHRQILWITLFSIYSSAVYAQPLVDSAKYLDAVESCLNALLEHGRDKYGPVHTPIFMSVIDTRTNTSPENPETLDALIRTEGRLHRRNPAGGDLWDDQALIRTLNAASKLTGHASYQQAAETYIKTYFERSKKSNGLLAWGTHIYYDAYKDAPGGDQDGNGPHEILIFCPEWAAMHAVVPEDVKRQIELLREWHVVDQTTGLFNRHDDKQKGCDFAFFGGELIYAFAFLSEVTNDKTYLDWAKTVSDRHWNARHPETGLAPDAPSTGGRYDAHHSFTTLPGSHAALLLKAFEATEEPLFKERALAYIEAYDTHAWDNGAKRYRAMLKLDGTPVMSQPKGAGYDRWKPTGYVDTWRSIMFSYEFPLIAAQTAVYAYEVTGSRVALRSARRWAEHIREELPPKLGRRWRDDLIEAVPKLEETGGTYAENYGRAISFFLGMHRVTGSDEDLRTAIEVADDALEKLQRGPWITGHPATPYYETVDGVGFLLHALLELAAYPDKLGVNL